MKISPAILIKKKCHGHQWFLASNYEWPPTMITPKWWSCCHPLRWLQRSWGNAESKVTKEMGLTPESCGVYEWNAFSKPRESHLPTQRMLNSLVWYLIFVVQTACSLFFKLVYSLTSTPASLEQFSQSYWDVVHQAWSSKHTQQIK